MGIKYELKLNIEIVKQTNKNDKRLLKTNQMKTENIKLKAVTKY